MSDPTDHPTPAPRRRTGRGRVITPYARRSSRGLITLATVTLGSGITMLDTSVVAIALPTIGRELNSSLGGLQWVNNGLILSLSALILVGGSLGDRLGRRRVYLVGVVWFALASLGCALAPATGWLVVARVLQGVGAALLTPGALAIIRSSFREEDQPAVIGTWAGVSGVAVAIGPFLGGWLLGHFSWRWIFLVNLPLCAVVILAGLAAVPESRDEEATGRFDVAGAGLTSAVLASLTWLLIDGHQWPPVLAATVATAVVAGAVAFVLVERRAAYPLVPLTLFSSRVFTSANLMTFLVYGALGSILFFLVLQLQNTVGFSPRDSGLATLPITIILMLLSAPMSTLAQRLGPRRPMTVGPMIVALGVLILSRVAAGSGWGSVLVGTSVFGLGLAVLVSPLTAAVLGAAPERLAGAASAINNAVARTGSLLAIAALPAVVGLSGADYRDAGLLTAGYRLATYITAALLVLGGLVSWFGLRGTGPAARPEPGPSQTPTA
ncbi:MFS transporter [Raineyella sp. W15-4]|uniref:MFS transporter n=1 Tax=Raineyella sp. W15-4 TaxID=3081651 RepID=UPI0029530397|nr:MFS transporter [Raineyella sp. W15-4]WOQ18613.1 MFS transporter [Raineyella sp. W15-4]